VKIAPCCLCPEQAEETVGIRLERTVAERLRLRQRRHVNFGPKRQIVDKVGTVACSRACSKRKPTRKWLFFQLLVTQLAGTFIYDLS
jgi:hypothetical protein